MQHHKHRHTLYHHDNHQRQQHHVEQNRSHNPDIFPDKEIFVRRANSAEDKEKVFSVRWRGYKKYFSDPSQVQGPLDFGDNAILLLATDANDEPIGTMRALDRSKGSIELDQFINVDEAVPSTKHPVLEGTRFSVPAHKNSKWIKLALWKAAFRYAMGANLTSLILWIRHSAVRDYQGLLFEKVSPGGSFAHPVLNGLMHHTWTLDLNSAKIRYKHHNHPFHDFFHEEEHPGIRCD